MTSARGATHPLVELAARAITSGGGETLALEPEPAAELRRALAEYFDTPELGTAVRELMAFAIYVGEELGAVATARALFDVACTATPALERRSALDAEAARREQEKYAARFSEPMAKAAPKVGAPAPPGTFTVSSVLTGKNRIRRG